MNLRIEMYDKRSIQEYLHSPEIKQYKSLLEKRVQRGSENGLWSCVDCEYKSRKKDHFREHVETHMIGVKHECPLCNKVLQSLKTLRIHITNIHKYANQTFNCDKCGKEGMTKVQFINHKRLCK